MVIKSLPQILTLILIFTVFGIFLSFKGIFLSKYSITLRATNQLEILQKLYNISIENPEQYQKNTKLILLLVDALKFSFVYNIPEQEKSPDQNYSYNTFTFPSSLLQLKPQNSLIYKSIADHPTTTSQRLKAIATGTIPVYMEIGQNLGTMRVLEDSFLYQLAQNNKKTIFMGDDAWTSIHNTSYYLRAYPYDSFDIYDLDGIDLTVHKHFFKELSNTDWHVLLAHCTGLDHAGHAYGGNNPEINRKLREMNFLTTQTITNIKENTTFMLFGDHGMLTNGNHGGSMEDEISTVLFTYATNGFAWEKIRLTSEYKIFEKIIKQIPYNKFIHPLNDTENQTKIYEIKQIDMVPTISILMNIPIPHNSLGVIIPKIIMQNCENIISCMNYLTVSYLQNAVQAYVFLDEYLKHPGNSQQINAKYKAYFYSELIKYKNELIEMKNSEKDLEKYLKITLKMQTELNELIKENANKFRASWLEFDPTPAYASVYLLEILAICSLLVILYLMSKKNENKENSKKEIINFDLSWKLIGIIFAINLFAVMFLPIIAFIIILFSTLFYLISKIFVPLLANFKLNLFHPNGLILIFLVFIVFRIYTCFSDSLLYNEGIFLLFTKIRKIINLS